ncbi:MAG: hypothetical protein ABF449_08425 [Ethanoligenens sp.]
MGKQTIAKAKRSKQSRSRLLIVIAAAILAVAFATGASAQQVSTVSVQTTTSSQYKAATGGITDIDAPAAGATASQSLTVSGWALNPSGIDRVDVWTWDTNNHAYGLGSVAATSLTARQDVKAAFPDYGTLNSGYTLTVNTTKLPTGNYTLAVAGIGTDGSVQWATKNITIGPDALTDIDAPANGSEQDGNIPISGWALNHGGINRVDVYAWDSNGVAHSLGSVPATSLIARQDVQNAFPDFGALDSGYSLTVANKTLGTGKYTLAVAGIGNDGDVQWATRDITVGPAPLTDIDTPDWTRVTDGKLPVSGWALNKTGIGRVDMYALDSNGHYHSLGSVSGDALAARQDVENAFSAFNAINSGYSLTADVSSLSAGSYTLCIAGIGNDGSVQWATKQFSIPGTTTAAPITDIDTPSQTYTGVIPISGWALNSSGINRVDVYAYDSNGTPHGLGSVAADALTARPDVQSAYPSYGILNSGYSLSIPAGTLASGNYTLAVAGIGNDGSVQWATQGITVQKIANYQGVNETKTYTDEITGIQQTVQFMGMGAGYCEVAGGYASINTTSELGAAHWGFNATVSLIGSNGIHQGGSTAVVPQDGKNATFTFDNLTAGTYTIQLTAHDGTVVSKYSFSVDSNGNVE